MVPIRTVAHALLGFAYATKTQSALRFALPFAKYYDELCLATYSCLNVYPLVDLL